MRRLLLNTSWLQLLTISLIITSLILVLYFIKPAFTEILESKTLDLRFLYRGPVATTGTVVLAKIDEKSLDTIGKWPWPRTTFVGLIEKLEQAGASVMALDVGFFEPDEGAALEVLRDLGMELASKDLLSTEIMNVLEKRAEVLGPDFQFAEAVKKSKTKVVLGYFFHPTPAGISHLEEGSVQEKLKLIRSSAYRMIRYRSEEAKSVPLIAMYMPEANLPVLSEATRFSGYFNIFPDPDGVVRWMPLVLRCERYLFPSLSVRAIEAHHGGGPSRLTLSSYGVESLRVGETEIPTDELGRMMIPYPGPQGAFASFSVSDILEGKVPREQLENKIVVVGATAVGLYDLRVTPFSSTMPGLEIHAAVMDSVLSNRFLVRPQWLSLFDIALIVFVGVGLGTLLSRLRAVGGALCSGAFLIGYSVFAQFMFSSRGVWISVVYPCLNLILIYSSVTAVRYLKEEKERQKVKHAFNHYLTASVVNEILRDPEKLKLGGDKKTLTVLFSDIRGFTSISERLTPEDLVRLLNRYLTLMTDIVFKYEGTLDKYIGDAVMAIWGAPLWQTDHASRACDAAVDMIIALNQLQPLLDEMQIPQFRIGIGINTGDMVVGNMGSDERFDYTVMGDSVNLGSRLEGTNKEYGTSVIISGSTYQNVKDLFLCRELDCIRVKGKTEPITIYELLGRLREGSTERDLADRFHVALSLYKTRNFKESAEKFEDIMKAYPQDNPSKLYLERCRQYLLQPPPEDWDGVFTMTHK
ncbi:MAG: adenylate/guanylate cyclase domain-containing protein [Deltaproteobacteria bacterium]|nr:adenylate/guanylate cyclase domain-containing protein [Deltaproteobacteria bacterium]